MRFACDFLRRRTPYTGRRLSDENIRNESLLSQILSREI